jgi:hypothetical protein
VRSRDSPAYEQAFWARQAENTLDRATAMMPKLLYDRLDGRARPN